jgi:hypothetical protein
MPTFVPSKASGGSGGHFVRSRVQTGGGHFVPSGGGGGHAHKHRHGILGTLETSVGDVGHFAAHLGHDVESAALGIPKGLVETARHPIRSAKAIGKSYAQTYGPLFRGDTSKFLHQFYEHPLGPLLDLTAVLTLGAGAVARGGALAAKAGAISTESRLARLGERGSLSLRNEPALARAGQLKTGRHGHKEPAFAGLEDLQTGASTLEKPTSGNPFRRFQQNALHRVLNTTPAHMPLVGEVARFQRELDRLVRHGPLVFQQQVRTYRAAYGKLNQLETRAFPFRATALDPRDYARLLDMEHADSMPT